jgi:pSer/pThr/pTyr-binding forkhead associated (FHA) protein
MNKQGRIAPPRLVNITEGSGKEVIPLGKSMLLIGREGANLNFEDKTISKNHASIINQNGKFYLRDNGSMSGSYVNGQRVQLQELKHQDTIRFGEYFFMVDLGMEGSESTPERVQYPLITIPTSHQNERYKLSYELHGKNDEKQKPLTIVTTGYVQDSKPKSSTKIPLGVHLQVCPSCKAKVKKAVIFCPQCATRLM